MDIHLSKDAATASFRQMITQTGLGGKVHAAAVSASNWRDLASRIQTHLEVRGIYEAPLIISDTVGDVVLTAARPRHGGYDTIRLVGPVDVHSAIKMGFTYTRFWQQWVPATNVERLAERLSVATAFVANLDTTEVFVGRPLYDEEVLVRKLAQFPVGLRKSSHRILDWDANSRVGRSCPRSEQTLTLPEQYRNRLDCLSRQRVVGSPPRGFAYRSLARLRDSGITTYGDFVGIDVEYASQGREIARVIRPDGALIHLSGLGPSEARDLALRRMDVETCTRGR